MSYLRDSIDAECLRSLFLIDSYLEIERLQAVKGPPLKNSYEWILNHPNFLQWYNEEECQLLWITGGPGTGKTMLLIGIVNELQKSVTETDNLSFFFCSGASSQLNNATAVLRGLIYLLVNQRPSLISHVRKEFDRAGARLFEGDNAYFALSEIFQDILQDVSLGRTYLIIDALDECESGLSNLLDLIRKTATASFQVKWIVSNRETAKIKELHLSDICVRLDLDGNADYTSHAVETYIAYKVSELAAEKGLDEDLQQQVRDQLLRRANGTFLWVSLVIRELEKVEVWDVLEVLQETPIGLESLYGQMIHQMKQLRQWKYCQIVLSTVSTTYRPLSLDELGALSGLPEQISDEPYIIRIVESCGSFVIIRDRYLYFCHQSARDYLITNPSIGVLPMGVAEVHYSLFLRSLQVMSVTLRQDIYDLHAHGFPIMEVQKPDPDPLSLVRYACVYWIDHLCHAQPHRLEELSDNGPVVTFLSSHLLHWLEALSLLHGVSNGAVSVRKLSHLFAATTKTSSRVARFLNDAEKFVVSYGSIIERAPLQTYGAALVFCPMKSVVKECFWDERLPVIRNVSGITKDWGVCQQVLEGHRGSVWAVAFSPDGRQLASASNDQTVRLWDTSTGTQIQALEGHSGTAKAIAFSPDGRGLASASYDKTVRLWDTTTGACQATLAGHSDWVRSIAFSHQGNWLASSSNDKTIRLWNTYQEEYEEIFAGHSNWVNSVVFSPDDRLLASASHDKTVRLWDTTKRAWRQTLGAFETIVNSVNFSPNGLWLAISLDDRTVRLWNTETGAYGKILEGHSYWVSFTAFSPESKYLASASNDKSIRLWDVETATCRQILNGHRGSVNSICFSGDGKWLASASSDKTIRLWDTDIGADEQISEGHNGPIKAVALTYNGQWVASASKDKTIRLWRADTGTCQRTLEGHDGAVTAVAFSADGGRLASASEDRTVRLWDTSTGRCQRILEGHNGTIRAVTFSLDGVRLASASEDGKILLWDATTGDYQQALKVPTIITKLSFTEDGQLLSDRGLLTLGSDSTALLHQQAQSPCRVSVNKDWVRHDGKDLLWLPRDYRATCSIFYNDLLVLGHESGQLTVLELSLS